MSKYFIVNDIDRPYERLIAKMNEEGTLDYLSNDLFSYQRMSAHSATPLEDFGFEIEETAEEIIFDRVNENRAKYRDGNLRNWQGMDNFAIKKRESK